MNADVPHGPAMKESRGRMGVYQAVFPASERPNLRFGPLELLQGSRSEGTGVTAIKIIMMEAARSGAFNKRPA